MFDDGIEFNEHPPPRFLVKLMKRKFAEKLRDAGEIRLGSLFSYQNWENDELGDVHDGLALFHIAGHPIKIETANQVFVWSSSLPSISPERTDKLALSGGYDCRITVSNAQMRFKRINDTLKMDHPYFWMHCGHVKYDRGCETNRDSISARGFQFNVFQKSHHFSADVEYRISITNGSTVTHPDEHIFLVLGNCSDLVTIENYP